MPGDCQGNLASCISAALTETGNIPMHDRNIALSCEIADKTILLLQAVIRGKGSAQFLQHAEESASRILEHDRQLNIKKF